MSTAPPPTTDRATDAPPGWLVALSVVGGTTIWIVRFAGGYLLVPAACSIGTWPLHLLHAGSVLIAVGMVALPLFLLRTASDPTMRFLLLFAIALNGFFLGAILLESSATFLVDACSKGSIP